MNLDHDVSVRERRHAFAAVVEPEIEVMLRVARTLTGSDADAEDVVQEALIRAFGAIGRFDGRHPRAWLLTIVRRTFLNQNRRRRPVLLAADELDRGHRPAFGKGVEASAEDRVLDAQLDVELSRAIATLDPRFRAALVLVDVHDLSYAEAAAVLDVAPGTVMSRLSRARKRVRVAMQSADTAREEDRT